MAKKYFTKWDKKKEAQLGLKPDETLAALWGVPITIVTRRRHALRIKPWPARANQDLILDNLRICYKCKRTQPLEEFYTFKNSCDGLSTQCRTCISKMRRTRRHSRKQEMVNMMGGKCNRCGYNETIAALEFHHVDPDSKEWNLSDFSDISRKRFGEIFDELYHCVLLCSNCHRGLHSGEIEVKLRKHIILGWEVINDCII